MKRSVTMKAAYIGGIFLALVIIISLLPRFSQWYSTLIESDTVEGDYTGSNKVINVHIHDPILEQLVMRIAREESIELKVRYPRGHVVFGFNNKGLIIPKGFNPGKMVISWETVSVHNISDSLIEIIFPDVIDENGNKFFSVSTKLKRSVGARSERVIVSPEYIPNAEILYIKDDFVIVALGYE